MTPREIASLWLIGIAGIFLIIWDHRVHVNTILSAVTAPGAAPDNTIETSITSNLTTNAALPMAGNEFGRLAAYGTPLSGDVQPHDLAFGDIWNSLTQRMQ